MRTLAPLLLVSVLLAGCGEEPAAPGVAGHGVAGDRVAGQGVTAHGLPENAVHRNEKGELVVEKLVRSDAEWRKVLTPEQYRILREKGTERPGTGALLHNAETGVYCCAACGMPLFKSDAKFDSGCGWPSFFEPLEGAHITETPDPSLGYVRTEITCSRCGGHLGHVFTDGPQPTGLRYCVNSVSLEFEKQADDAKEADGEGD
jgi:peptide-methionine (R)-S-oxide reductase